MRVLLGVSSSISVYKTPSIVSGLNSTGHEVKVVMTDNAAFFVGKLCFQAECFDGQFNNPLESSVAIKHIDLADWAEIFLIAPGTANIIVKFANWIADDLLSTVNLAMNNDAAKVMYPAMNPRMFESSSDTA